jgi:hypothetical protein
VTYGSPAHFRLLEDTGSTPADADAGTGSTPIAPAACGFRIGGC